MPGSNPGPGANCATKRSRCCEKRRRSGTTADSSRAAAGGSRSANRRAGPEPMAAPDPHAPLRDDVRLLGTLLGETLRAREGDGFFALIERVRAMAKSAHDADRGQFDQLADLLRDLPLASAVPVARAFAHFLSLANIAEQ